MVALDVEEEIAVGRREERRERIEPVADLCSTSTDASKRGKATTASRLLIEGSSCARR